MNAQKQGIDTTKSISSIVDEYFYTSNDLEVYSGIISGIERTIITKALERFDGNQVAAAKMLGIHRNTLNNKLKKLGIDVKGFKK